MERIVASLLKPGDVVRWIGQDYAFHRHAEAIGGTKTQYAVLRRGDEEEIWIPSVETVELVER